MGMTGASEAIRGAGGRVLLRQSIAGCRASAIGKGGLADTELARLLADLAGPLADLQAARAGGTLSHLAIPYATDDLVEAERAMAALVQGADLVIFLGTGGSSLGGQTLAQLTGWNIPGAALPGQKKRPRTRFYDNLDAGTLGAMLEKLDLARTRFVLVSKSGNTPETLAQAIAAIGAVRRAGLEGEAARLFLGLTDPDRAGGANGLRALARRFGFPVLDHHPGIGGRYSCLTNVGLLPAIARGLDVRAVRAGAAAVVDALAAADGPASFPPAVAAALAVGLAREKGVRVNVMMPYSDRLARFGAWYVQLWAESLGKRGVGTTPVASLGPLDQHSQLQLFMDGPAEHYFTFVRGPMAGEGPILDPELARLAGLGFMAGRPVGDLVAAAADAVPQALLQAGRPVRTLDLDRLDGAALGALLMSFMLETMLAARLLGVDAFDQPAVELAKTITRERLARP